MNSIRQRMDGSVIKRGSLAAQLGIAKTEKKVVDAVGANKTQFEKRSAAELWMNIGGKDFRLVGRTIRIGRAEDNDIVLDHKSVSRYHAILTISGNKIILEDLKSRNGISINSAQVKRGELSDNDEVSIGDVAGVFFERVKKAGSKTEQRPFSPHEFLQHLIERIRGSKPVETFEALEPKRKRMVVGVAAVLLCIALFSVSKPRHDVSPTQNLFTTTSDVDLRPSDRKSFERCLEAEDLGNLRQANMCFKNLAQTTEVQIALERVQKRQSEISEERYREGKQALENYYYDVALQKFQEVILVSDDNSEYRLQATKGIQDAEEKKRRL